VRRAVTTFLPVVDDRAVTRDTLRRWIKLPLN